MANWSLWFTEALNRLAHGPCGYHAASSPAAEPTALAALALLGAGRPNDAQSHLHWLAKWQSVDGSEPPLAELKQPGWPTPITTLAAAVAARPEYQNRTATEDDGFDLSRASGWLLAATSKPGERSREFGHDPRLIGWPWVLGTHSWQEPTAWAVLALKAIGLAEHPRTREGVRLLVDRLLVTGGCNYGNTVVLGQRLRPHLEPTGVALLALAGEQTDDPRIDRSLNYLASALSAETTPISLSYGLLGLSAHERTLPGAKAWLEAAYDDTVERDASPLALALLVLAAQAAECPLIKMTHVQASQRLSGQHS